MNDEMKSAPSGAAASLAELVSQGHSIIKIENETQQAIAIQRPRDEEKVLARALADLERSPEFAASAFWERPVGKDDEGKQTDAKGLSIRAAESLVRLWGNIAAGGRVFLENEDRIVITGKAIDYETNAAIERPFVVSKSAWSKKTQAVVRLREDRLAIAMQAGVSKAIRNASLALLPTWLKEAYFKKAISIATGGGKPAGKKAKPIADRIEQMVAKFGEKGVKAETLFAYLGVQDEPTDQQLAKAIGVYNAIEEGEATVEEIFGAQGHASSTGERQLELLEKRGMVSPDRKNLAIELAETAKEQPQEKQMPFELVAATLNAIAKRVRMEVAGAKDRAAAAKFAKADMEQWAMNNADAIGGCAEPEKELVRASYRDVLKTIDDLKKGRIDA